MDDDDEYYNSEDQDVTGDFNIRASIGFHDEATEAAEFLNNLLSIHIPDDIHWSVSKTKWTFELHNLAVDVQNTNGFAVIASSNVIPRKALDTLRADLRLILRKALEERVFQIVAFGVTLLQLVEEAQSCVDVFQASTAPRQQKSQGWNAGSIKSFEQIMENPYGVDLSSVNDTAKFILGQSITDICEGFPEDLRILHAEPVFRSDLVGRFLRRRSDMKEELTSLPYNVLKKSVTRNQITSMEVVDTSDGIAEYLVTPKITFHGAPRHVVSSIVRYGFLIPGEQIGRTRDEVQVMSGSCYGRGIYSSPSQEYASFYGRWTAGSGESLDFFNPSQVPGFRIIVCATLMGRALEVGYRQAANWPTVFREGAHSHVSENKLEYVVFNKAQIVPCYVLHVDYGSDVAKDWIQTCMKDPSNIGTSKRKSRIQLDSYADDMDCPGARKAEKQALKAAAAKWFPYGYGPARGENFTILEIGHVSDDEEEYGDFQSMRQEQNREIQDWAKSRNEKTSWFDEYQYVRNTKREVELDDKV